MAEGHAVNGTALSTFCIEGDYEPGLNDLGGDDLAIGYQRGLAAGSRTVKGRDYPLYLTITGQEPAGIMPRFSRARLLDNANQLAALLLNLDADLEPQPFTLTRVLPLSSGASTHTINARYIGGFRLAHIPETLYAARVVPVLRLLDPFWLDGLGNRIYL